MTSNMRILIKFKVPMTKNGVKHSVGDTIEIDATQAVALATRGVVEIPGYRIEQRERIVIDDILVPENE